MFNWLKRLITRAGDPFDNPNIPLSEGLALGWTRPSPSGFPVTESSVMGIPAFRRAVQLIAGHIARLDLVGYRIGRNGSRDRYTSHPAYNLLHWRPSPLYSAVDWKQAAVKDCLIKGNHYSWIIRDQYANPEELLRLEPSQVQPLMVGDHLLYKVRLPDNTEKYLTDDSVLHFKALGNGLVGISLADTMLDALGLAGALGRYASTYFANNCHPGITLKYIQPPAKGSEGRDALKANLERLHLGLDKAHRIAVIPWGLDRVDDTVDAEKAQLLESRQFSLIDIANALGISPNRLGANVSTNYGSLESERKAFLEDLEIYLCSFEEEINYKLLTEAEKRLGRVYYEFDRSTMEKPDAATEDKIWADRVNNGLCTWNEYRQATNQATVDEPWADRHRMPAQLLYAEDVGQQPQAGLPTLANGQAGDQPQPDQPDGQADEDAVEGPQDAPGTQPDAAADQAAGRLAALVEADVDRLVTRLRKAAAGKPAEWWESEDFLTHRDVFVKAIPWGADYIDAFLEDAIECRQVQDIKVAKLKEILCRTN